MSYPQSPPAVIQVFVKGTFPKRIKVQFLHLFLTALFLCPEGSPGCSPDAGRLPDEEGWLLTDEGRTREKFRRRDYSPAEGNTTKPHMLREPEDAAEI